MSAPSAMPADRLRARAVDLLQVLRGWPWRDTLRTLQQRFREDRLALTASSLTFTTLIALVPLLTVMLALFSAFPMFRDVQLALQTYFVQTLVPDAIAKPVLGALTQFAAKASQIGGVGLLLLLGTALALMLTIDRTLNNIWRVRTPRPIAQRVLVYWAAMTLGPLALGLSLSISSYALTASRGWVGALPGGVSFALSTLEFAVLVGGIAALFHYVPNTHVRWRHALAGAVFIALGFQAAQHLLAWYLRAVPTYSMIYGAFATLPIFLVWLYLSWVVVLFGAVIAAYAPSLQMRSVRRTLAAGHAFALAVDALRELARARAAQSHGLGLSELAERLGCEPLQLEPVLDTLIALDWAGRLDEGGERRHVLLCEPASTAARPLVAKLLIDPAAGVPQLWRRLEDITLQELLA